MDDNKIRITVEDEGRKLIIETYSDNSIWDWKPVFTSILNFLTFHPDTIEQIFKEE